MNWLIELALKLFPSGSLLAAVLSLAVGACGAWWAQGLRIDTLKAEHAVYVVQVESNVAKAEKAQLEIAAHWRKAVDDANAESQKRIDAMQADVDSSRAAAGGLRNTVAALRTRLADATRTAAIDAAAAAGELLAQCGEEYRGMAETAQRHANDVRALTEAWPRNGSAEKGGGDGS